MPEQLNAFDMAQKQFDSVAEMLKLDPGVREVLRWPMREYSFRIPIRMDDGSIRVFQGFRVQHNDARGPITATATSRGETCCPFTSIFSRSSKPKSRIASMMCACPGYRSVLYSIVGIFPS